MKLMDAFKYKGTAKELAQKRQEALRRRSESALRKRPLEFNVAGISRYGAACAALTQAAAADQPRVVTVRPERNPYDPHAMAVFVNGHRIGCVPWHLTGRARERLSPATAPALVALDRFSAGYYAKVRI